VSQRALTTGGERLRGALRRSVPLRIRRPLGNTAYRLRRDIGFGLRQILGRLPFLAARDLVYDDWFFDKVDPGSGALYERLVETLLRSRSPRSVVDVGCGSGLMLAKFAERGVAVRGIEGSRAAVRRSPVGNRIVRANLERGVPALGRFDLCLCIEVAEHLSSRSAPRLVAGLTRLSDLVVFTAAPPGQGGMAHLNMKPKSYWQALFAAHAFLESPLASRLLEEIADIPKPEYIHRNLMVFERMPSVAAQSPRGAAPSG
jgi:2-polyprenyl-3-methyl-5-hydroxy-6-metoxy-1,4-benzoquinol methylase